MCAVATHGEKQPGTEHIKFLPQTTLHAPPPTYLAQPHLSYTAPTHRGPQPAALSAGALSQTTFHCTAAAARLGATRAGRVLSILMG